MMVTQLKDSNNLLDLDKLSENVGNMAKEIAKREFELLELNLFVSSVGKKKLDKATQYVEEMREMEKSGKINLAEFDEEIEKL